MYKIIDSVWYTPPGSGMSIIDAPFYIGVVAIRSGPEDDLWKAYIGICQNFRPNEELDSQYIAAHGVKMTRQVACAHSPELRSQDYLY